MITLITASFLAFAVLRVQGRIYTVDLEDSTDSNGLTYLMIDTEEAPVLAPALGERLKPGTTYNIKVGETGHEISWFQLADVISDTLLRMVPDGNIVAGGSLDSGTYVWIIPDNIPEGSQYVLLPFGTSDYYGISAVFAIDNSTTIVPTTTAQTTTSKTIMAPTSSLTSSASPVFSSTDSTKSTPSLARSSSSSPTTFSISTVISSATETPAPSPPSNHPSGAVIGGAVGGALGGVILVLAAVLVLLLRRRRARNVNTSGMHGQPNTIEDDHHHHKPELDSIPSPRAELDSPRPPTELPAYSPQPGRALEDKSTSTRGSDGAKLATLELVRIVGFGGNNSHLDRSASNEGPHELPGLESS